MNFYTYETMIVVVTIWKRNLRRNVKASAHITISVPKWLLHLKTSSYYWPAYT